MVIERKEAEDKCLRDWKYLLSSQKEMRKDSY
jgi:hypothetical protein